MKSKKKNKALKERLISSFTKIKKYEMHSKYSIDIDNQFDFDFAEFIIKK